MPNCRAGPFGWAPQEWWAIALGGAGVRLVLLGVAFAMTFALLLLVSRGEAFCVEWLRQAGRAPEF